MPAAFQLVTIDHPALPADARDLFSLVGLEFLQTFRGHGIRRSDKGELGRRKKVLEYELCPWHVNLRGDDDDRAHRQTRPYFHSRGIRMP